MTLTLIAIAMLIGTALIIIGFMRSGTAALLSGAAIFLVALLVASVVYAHESHTGMKYEAYCCNGNSNTGDCQDIPFSSVRIMSDGYEITIEPGQHRLVTKRHVFKVAFQVARQSTDNEYHLCLYPNEDTFRCLYAPPMSF